MIYMEGGRNVRHTGEGRGVSKEYEVSSAATSMGYTAECSICFFLRVWLPSQQSAL